MNRKPRELVFEQDINPAEYVRIPETSKVISKEQQLNKHNLHKAREEAGKNGLYVASARLFMPYRIAVKEAAEGKIRLYDGNNHQISREEAKDLNERLVISLDDEIVQGNGFKGLAVRNYLGRRQEGKKIIETTETSPLEKCLFEDGVLVDLKLSSFNSQGLPIRRSRSHDYKHGENICFYHPEEGKVARFYAVSGRAVLFCDVDPGDSDSWLGVLLCAEGTPKNKYKMKKRVI